MRAPLRRGSLAFREVLPSGQQPQLGRFRWPSVNATMAAVPTETHRAPHGDQVLKRVGAAVFFGPHVVG